MSIAQTFGNIRIIPREATYLDKKYGSYGEIFFDRDSKTLKLFDGETRGGVGLAKASLDNVTNAAFLAKATSAGVGGGSGSIEVSDTAPSSPDEGTIWFDSSTAKIYVYVNDGTSSQWIQPVAPVPGSILDLGISDGTNGYVLTTNGSGTFTFQPAGASSWSELTGKPTTIAGYGITDAFDGAFASLTSKPTTLSGYGITDGQVALVSGTNIKTINGTSVLGSGNITISGSGSTGNIEFTGNTIDSLDSTAITFTPAVNVDSDLNAGNDLTVGQDATVAVNLTVGSNATIQNNLTVGNNLIITGEFTSNGSGTPEIFSNNEIQLTAGTRVELTSSPIKMASFTTAARDALIASNGDLIYNSSTNKFQGYENGAWVNLV